MAHDKEARPVPDIRVISWNIKDFANTRYTNNCNIIQRQLYDNTTQLCDLFVIIEPKIGTNKGTLGKVVQSGSGFKAMLALFDWLYLKDNNWKMVPPLMSSGDTRADCVAVYYDSSKLKLDGPDLDRECAAPRPVTPPWQNAHPGQVRHLERKGGLMDFQGRRPYLVKFHDATAAPQTTLQAITLTIQPAVPAAVVAASSLTISTGATLPVATLNEPYSLPLACEGASGTLSWTLKGGSTLPAGLNLDGTSGVLDGTPTTAGAFTVDVEAKDGSGSTSKSLDLKVGTIAITSPPALPHASQNSYYLFTPQVECVHGTMTWSLASGTLPPGLVLDTTNGTISGEVGSTATTQNFQLSVDDGNTQPHTLNCTLTVTDALTITTTEVPQGKENQAYSVQLKAVGGYLPTAWHTASTLPSGMTLSRSGLLSGTPTDHGTFALTLEATCHQGFFLVAIHAPPQTFSDNEKYKKNAHILMVKTLTRLRETTSERMHTRVLLVGDYNVCDQVCCSATDDHEAFTSLATTYNRHTPPAPRSSLAVFDGGKASNALKASWTRNAFDHVFSKGFAATDINNLNVVNLVTEHAHYKAKALAVNTITQVEWNAIFREVLWRTGVSDHLPVKFTLTI